MKVVITGANGFIGKFLCSRLTSTGYEVLPVVRRPSGLQNERIIPDIHAATDWDDTMANCETIVHLAARVHVMRDNALDSLVKYRLVNVYGTLNLAVQAATAGVRRFVYLSTIKVNGEQTIPGQLFREDDLPAPCDPYAISKYEAEKGLKDIARQTGMELVIIRPPLVYGPGVKANFLNIMKWLYHGVPLPFGAVNNKRSLVALDNLTDFIMTCIIHSAAINQTFLVSDGNDLSLTELLRLTAEALGKKSRLLPVPQQVLASSLKIIGKKDLEKRLCGSLQVDINKAKTLLGWVPKFSVTACLLKTAADFILKGM